MTNHKKLIEEAREFASRVPLGKPRATDLDKAIGMARRLADALEAATTEPEWEYADSPYREGPGPKHLAAFSAQLATLEQRNEERVRLGHAPLSIWKRREAGPWLPVEGESRP